MRVRIIPIQGAMAAIMNKLSIAAITMPWGHIYVQRRFFGRHDILRHELVHIEQMERDGRIWFSLKYLWWLARYGYWKNPYEIEAYSLEPICEA